MARKVLANGDAHGGGARRRTALGVALIAVVLFTGGAALANGGGAGAGYGYGPSNGGYGGPSGPAPYEGPPSPSPYGGEGETPPSSGSTGGGGGTTTSAGSGVSGKTASVTSSQIAALLASQLTPSGSAAKTASLLKRDGYTIAFTAPEAGKAVIDWYEVPAGAKLAKNTKPKPVLVANGQHAFLAAGTATIKIDLTLAGKAILKRVKKIKLSARGTFTPTGKPAVTAVKTFVLKR